MKLFDKIAKGPDRRNYLPPVGDDLEWHLSHVGRLNRDGTFLVETCPWDEESHTWGPATYQELSHPEMSNEWLQAKIAQLSELVPVVGTPASPWKRQGSPERIAEKLRIALDYLFAELGRRAEKLVLP